MAVLVFKSISTNNLRKENNWYEIYFSVFNFEGNYYFLRKEEIRSEST